MDHYTHGPFYTTDGDTINTEQVGGRFPKMISIRLFTIETLTAVSMWTAYDYPRLSMTTQRLPQRLLTTTQRLPNDYTGLHRATQDGLQMQSQPTSYQFKYYPSKQL